MKPMNICSIKSCEFCVTDERVFEIWKKSEVLGESNCANGDDAYQNCRRRVSEK